MYRGLNKILAVISLMFLQTCAISQGRDFCSIVTTDFIKSQKVNDWINIDRNVDKFKKCKCEIAPMLYYTYRLHMLLPNSHALVGISPNDYIVSQKSGMNKQVNILKNCPKNIYNPFISAMIEQTFDIEITEAANELRGGLILPRKIGHIAKRPF